VESANRLPVQLTGYVLFNAFLNGARSGDTSHPTTAAAAPTQAYGGATFRQSILGLKFQGPRIAGDGRVTGQFYMDFFGGTGTPLNSLLRIRVATLDLGWANTTVSFGQDKPIVAPREPESLAQVGVSPLTQAGNLWFWLPQARIEQRWALGREAGAKLQLGVIQTNESTANVPSDYLATLSRARPGLEGRFEIWKAFAGGRRIEIAPGLHASDSKVDGATLPSRIYTLDWLVRPWQRIEVTGTYYAGTNTQVLGGLRPGITYFADGTQRAAHGAGGWAQLSIQATKRTKVNLYAGQESHRARDLAAGSMLRNLVYAGNVIYRIGPNVAASFEMYQARTLYLGQGLRLVPHYDLALAYSF